MPTIVDELVVTLGLDSRKFDQEVQKTDRQIQTVRQRSVKGATELEDSVKKSGRAMHSLFLSLGDVGKETSERFNALRLSIGGLFAALGGYALQRFVMSTANMASGLGYLSKSIGISTRDLGAWGEAATRTGGSVEATGASLYGLSQAITAFKISGEDNGVISTLRALNIQLTNPATGRIKPVTDLLLDLASAFEKMPRADVEYFGRLLHLDQGTITLLSKGRAEVEKIVDAKRELGIPDEGMTEKWQEFLNVISDVKQAFTYLGMEITTKFADDITRFLYKVRDAIKSIDLNDLRKQIDSVIKKIEDFATWVDNVVEKIGGWKVALEILFGIWFGGKVLTMTANLAVIAAGFGGITSAVSGLSTALRFLIPLLTRAAPLLGVLSLKGDTPDAPPPLTGAEREEWKKKWEAEHPGQKLEEFPEWLDRMWKEFKSGIGSAFTLGGSTGGPSITGASNERMVSVRDMLSRDLGIDKNAASGIVSNLNAESGIQGINERNPIVPGSRGGFGWAQWTGPRRDEFEAFARRNGLDPASDAANYKFLIHELQTKPQYAGVLAKLRSGTLSAYQAAEVVARGYIIPPEPTIPGHLAGAEGIARLPTPGSAPSVPVPPASAVDPSLSGSLRPSSYMIDRSSSSDNRRSSSTKNETNINGPIVVQTAATDADGIARGLNASLRRYIYVPQANTGLV